MPDLLTRTRRWRGMLALTMTLLAGSLLGAQAKKRQFPRIRHLPYDYDRSHAGAAGDLDGDGDLVLACSSYRTNQNRVYLNDGKGKFSDAGGVALPKDDEHSISVVLGDVDGDKDLDLVFGNRPVWNRQLRKPIGGRNQLWLNGGKARFKNATDKRMPLQKEDTNAVLLVDVDEDRDLFAVNSGQTRLHRNRHRHGESGQNFGPPTPGGYSADYTLDFDVEPGHARPWQFVLPAVSFASAVIPLGSWGLLGLDPRFLVLGGPLPVSSPDGHASVQVHLADASGIEGLPIFVQGLVLSGASPADWRFTNTSRPRAR